MRSAAIAFLGLLLSFRGFTQTSLYIEGDSDRTESLISISSGAVMYVSGDILDSVVVSESKDSRLLLGGILYLDGDIKILASDTRSSVVPPYAPSDTSVNAGKYIDTTSTGFKGVVFTGDSNQVISGDSVYLPGMLVSKASGDVKLEIKRRLTVMGPVILEAGNLDLGTSQLYLEVASYSKGYIYGETEQHHITGDGGEILVESASYSDSLTFNPGGIGLHVTMPDASGFSGEFRRIHNTMDSVADGSINRYYKVVPVNGFEDSYFDELSFTYFIDELNGINSTDLGLYFTSETDADGRIWVPHDASNPGSSPLYATDDLYLGTTNLVTLGRRNCVIAANIPSYEITTSVSYHGDPVVDNEFTDGAAYDICETSDVVFSSSVLTYPYYSWYFGNTNSLLAADDSYSIDDINSNQTGEYILYVRNNRGCEDTHTLTVNVRSNPVSELSISPNNANGRICTPQLITFNGSASYTEDNSAIQSYIWEYADGGATRTTASDTTAHYYHSENLYFPELTVMTEYGCYTLDEDIDIDSLTILDPPAITAMSIEDLYGSTITEICELDTARTTASALYEDTTPSRQQSGSYNDIDYAASLIYDWDFDDGTVIRDNALADFSDTLHRFVHRYSNEFWVKVTVTDKGPSYGCSSVDSTWLYVHPKPEIAFVPKYESDNSALNGEICEGVYLWMDNQTDIALSAYLPSSISEYDWDFDNGVTSQLAQPLLQYTQEGLYDISMIAFSDKGCSDTLVYALTVNPAPDGVVGQDVYAQEDSVCLGQEVIFINGTTIPYGTVDYLWNFGDGSVSTESEPIHLYSDAGRYPVSLTRTSDKGCENTLQNMNVVINENPVALFEASDVCDGVAMQFYNMSYEPGSADDVRYRWDFGDATHSSSDSPQHLYSISSFGDASDSTFLVEMIVVTNAATTACADTIWKEVTVNRNPSFDVGNAILAFADTLVDPANDPEAFLPAGTTYQWKNVLGQSLSTSQSYRITATGSYYVTLLSTLGCENTVDFPVYILEKADLGGNQVFCTSGILDAEPSRSQTLRPVSYSWYSYAGSASSTLPSDSSELYVNMSGNYGVLVSYEVLGVTASTSDEAEIEVVDPSSGDAACEEAQFPEVDLGGDVVTCDASVILDAENSGSTYLWSDGSTGRKLEVFESGTYSVTVTKDNGNSAADTVNVTFLQSVKPDLGDSLEVCGGVLLEAGVEAVSYWWSTGATSESIYVSLTDVYGLQVISSDLCINQDTVDVTVFLIPDLDLGSDIAVCDGEPVSLQSNITGTYLWSTGDTTSQISVAHAGDYELTLTSSDGCSATDTIEVSFYPLPEIDLDESYTACDNLLLDAGTDAVSWLWSTGETTASIELEESGYFWVKGVSEHSCVTIDTTFVTINDNPEVDLGDDIHACVGDIVTLDAGINNSTFMVKWNTGVTGQTIEVTASGTYTVSVESLDGCTSTDAVKVYFHQANQPDLGEDRAFCASDILDAGASAASYEWGSSTGEFWTTETILPSESGTYWVTVTDAYGCTASDTVILHTTSQTLEASFLIPSVVSQGDYVSFVALTDPEPEAYFWEFGDGSTSTLQNPFYQYFTPGEFTVTLTVSNGTCSSSLSKQITVDAAGTRTAADESGGYKFVEILNTQVYPNPISDGDLTLSIDLSDESVGEISFYDLRGVRVFNHEYQLSNENKLSFDLSGLHEGMYIILVEIGHQIRHAKFIKVK